MATTDLAVRRNGPAELTFPELMSLADSLARSNFFGVKDGAQALAKIMAGREMGFEAVASLMGVHIIEGKPTISAGLMASAVKRSGKYSYRIEWAEQPNGETTGVILTFTESGAVLGTSEFTLADAERAGLAGKSVWKSYRRNMLFARAMSNGVRWYCPDIFQGAVYTPEELGQDVDEEGNAVNVVVPQSVVTVLPSGNGNGAHSDPHPFDQFLGEAESATHREREAALDEVAGPPACADCDKPIKRVRLKDTGEVLEPEEIRERSLRTFGRVLCAACAGKEAAVLKQQLAAQGQEATY